MFKKVENILKEVENRIDRETPGNILGNMTDEEFRLIMQTLLISEDGYVIDTGNYSNANYAVIYKLLYNIKKHPILWKLFFMVA